MFNFRNHQELTCIAEGDGHFFAKVGAMVAYKGNFTSEKVLLDTNNTQSVFKSVLNLAARKLSGENVPIMKVNGQGSYYMASRAQHISIITLGPGQSIGVEGENLLAFTEVVNTVLDLWGQGLYLKRVCLHQI